MSDSLPSQDLDLSLLHEIADGSDEFIVESIDMFLQQTPISLQEVSNAIAVQDWPVAAASAHKMKATLGFFGMLSCQALVQDIEHSCKTGAPNPMDVYIKFKQVQAYINFNTNALVRVKAEAASRL